MTCQKKNKKILYEVTVRNFGMVRKITKVEKFLINMQRKKS